ncbi:hypothetical protein NBC2815_04002 (plasmid) [Xanthomonas fragariae]|nr:hypothetical protein NBC2815_04002 [Xanthomonas fragariae]
MTRWVIDVFTLSAEGRSSPRDFNITSSPQALCVNAQRCPHGAQAAKRPERVGGPGEGRDLQPAASPGAAPWPSITHPPGIEDRSMRARRSFPPELLAQLRVMPVTEALDLLGLYWKRDPDFRPLKDKATVRVNVSIGGGVVELLATGPK